MNKLILFLLGLAIGLMVMVGYHTYFVVVKHLPLAWSCEGCIECHQDLNVCEELLKKDNVR